jgi:hypothetical protein
MIAVGSQAGQVRLVDIQVKGVNARAQVLAKRG